MVRLSEVGQLVSYMGYWVSDEIRDTPYKTYPLLGFPLLPVCYVTAFALSIGSSLIECLSFPLEFVEDKFIGELPCSQRFGERIGIDPISRKSNLLWLGHKFFALKD